MSNENSYAIDVDEYDSTCLICYDTFLDEDTNWIVRSNSCGCQKIYHLKCFYDWYKDNKECPICRSEISDSDLNAMIYHNKKWKILPLNLISDIYFLNDFNKIYGIETNHDQNSKESSFCNLLFQIILVLVCISILVLLIFIYSYISN